MALAYYVKETPRIAAPRSIEQKRKDKVFSLAIISIGIVSIFFATWPSILWQLKTVPKLTTRSKDSPIPQEQVLSVKTTLANVQVAKDEDGFSYFITNYKPEGQRPKEFLLTVPKLKIHKAKVGVDTLKFDKQLSHFPGSAIPGDVGNSFVTGHSALPQFSDPENYREIFSKLDELEIGDEVYVEVGDKTYQYIVQYAKIVDPKDTSVLSPISPESRNLTLMTCVPPGTNLKRLVVITSLI